MRRVPLLQPFDLLPQLLTFRVALPQHPDILLSPRSDGAPVTSGDTQRADPVTEAVDTFDVPVCATTPPQV